MRVTSKGQVTIPKAVRQRQGIMPGTNVEFLEDGDTLRLVKARGRSRMPTRGERLVARIRGTAKLDMSTDDLMKLLRGWDEEPPGVLD